MLWMLLPSRWDFFTIFITMNTMDIIFNDEDYYDELLKGTQEPSSVLAVGL